MARRTGDTAALVDAIRLCQWPIMMPQTLALRLAGARRRAPWPTISATPPPA